MSAIKTTKSNPKLRLIRFSQALKWSCIVHVGLILVFILRFQFFPSETTLYVPSLKVDLVALPEVLKKDLGKDKKKKQEETKQAKKKEKEKDKEKPKKNKISKKSQKKDELKSAIEQIREETKEEEVRGNKISKGSTTTGEAREALERSYFDDVHANLIQNWSLPVWLERQNLSAQAHIYVDTEGRILTVKLTKRSGNERFDQEVKRAIERSNPFPAPPKELRGSLESNGILLGFPL